MKLLEAMRIINEPADAAQPTRRFVLATGFTPVALETFFHAELRERTRPANVAVSVGRFGDLPGNLDRAAAEKPDGVAVVVEWADVEPRLGLRGHGAVVAPGAAADVIASAQDALARLEQRVARLAETTAVAVLLPTLPLPPYFLDPPSVVGGARLQLDALVAGFAARVAGPRVRVIDAARLAATSPHESRWDVSGELTNGFPYRREHAAAVGAALATALRPAAPKKGLITDLDDTLWRGILGEVGVAGVKWGQEHGAHVHSLYQQALVNLAEAGVLVAVASKNEAKLVAEALDRDDLICGSKKLFPVHASWGPKSAAVAAIVDQWNIGADSVVFVDDSPLELGEVKAAHPGVECLQFEPHNPASVVALLQRLGELFGRTEVREEDRIRSESIRNAAAVREAAQGSADDADAFLAGLGAQVELVFSRDATDGRALELMNKTNQFNLNGRRFGEAEWAEMLARPDAFLLTVAYKDKFGPLGKIEVVTGTASDGEVRVDGWVLSCRAFARRIEHLTLRTLFERFDAEAVTLDAARTPRNGPTQEFVAAIGAEIPEEAGAVRITRAEAERRMPTLHHAPTVRAAGEGAEEAGAPAGASA